MSGVAQQTTVEQLSSELAQTARALPGQTPLFFRAVTTVITSFLKRDFDACRAPDGTTWEPLRFPRARGGTKPLHDTGLLRGSLTGGSNHIERIEGDTLWIGTNREGASLMNAGGTIVPVKAKALAIPLTPEAASYSSPRQFPRKLALIWKKGANHGILAEFPGKKKGTKRQEGHGQFHEGTGANRMRAIFFLCRKAVVPARPFIGFGTRLVDRVSQFAQAFYQRFIMGDKTQPPQQEAA